MEQKRPRIACYLRSLYGGGAERVMINLIQSLIEKGLDVDLLLHSTGGSYWSQIPPQVSVIELKTDRLLIGLPLLINYLRREKPTALLTAMHYTNEIAILAKHLARVQTRVVVSERNTLSVHARQFKSSERWSPLVAKLLYPWADGIVAVSQGVAQDLLNLTGLSENRISVIYNPVITPEMQQKSQEKLDHPWFKPGEPPVILGVGRLTEQKDFPTLIRAFAQVRQVQSARLIILGNGSERKKLKLLIQELDLENEVTLLGFVENPYAYMAKAKVFVLSSAWEGFGNVLVEAMAVGTPVISTNCESGPAEILDNGKYGDLVPVGDSNALAAAILKVLSAENPPILASWLEQFTLETATQQYSDILGINLL
jgi:glycosyltransferase involved in cell wall biosynthesis